MMYAAIIAMILGSVLKQKQEKNAAKRKIEEMRVGREKAKVVQKDQRGDVLKTADTFDPNTRQVALDDAAAEAEAKINAVLEDNELITTGDAGYLSDKVLEQRANSTRDKANTASVMAALMSKVQAPGDTQFTENQDMLNLADRSKGRTSNLGRINNTTQTLAQLEGMMDPKALMAAGVLQQLGMAMASGSIMSGLSAPGMAAGGSVGPATTTIPATNVAPGVIV